MIQLIAVDMDGTFLSDTKDYDRARFATIYQQLLDNDIKFVVASGNQYYQLRSFFPDIHKDIAFVAENGALVIDQHEEIACAQISDEEIDRIIAFLAAEHPELVYVVCGRKSAYMLEKDADAYYDTVNKFYHRLEVVSNFDNLHQRDTIFKFALTSTSEVYIKEVQAMMEPMIGDVVHVQHCGHGDLDLNAIGINKAVGLNYLLEKYDIPAEKCMSFGDSGNDLELLTHVGYGYAMENATAEIKAVTALRAPSNNLSGVLETIEKYLDTL